MISSAEIVAGLALVLTGGGAKFGMWLLGTGLGSLTNGLINMSYGGSYSAGWIGGQVSGLVSFFGLYGSTLGCFTGSILTDLLSKKLSQNRILKKRYGLLLLLLFYHRLQIQFLFL